MHKRCRLKSDKGYPVYGARGIMVCERWKKFENFLADMGVRPEGKSLDRFPNRSGNYEPGNCRWATPREQTLNRDVCIRLVHNGKEMLLHEVAADVGLSIGALRSRLKKYGLEKAISMGPSRSRRKKR